MKHARPFVLALGLTAGCALKGDVRRVELQVEALRVERARADSQRASEIDTVRALLRTAQEELTGQSQQRLTELRGRLEEQARQPVPALDTSRGGAGVPVGPSGNPAGPGPEQMYDLAYQQYRASRYGTARQAFREFLRMFPTHERAPDALYFIGESFAGENADSAAAVYQQVVKTYPASPRAPSALYKLGFLAEQRGNKAGARTYYARVIADYPRAPEANLARDKLQRLGR